MDAGLLKFNYLKLGLFLFTKLIEIISDSRLDGLQLNMILEHGLCHW